MNSFEEAVKPHMKKVASKSPRKILETMLKKESKSRLVAINNKGNY